jgi:hypothetical protein
MHAEIKDDWARVPFSDLDSDCIAHLDAEGLRYYLAPLMLSVIEHYDAGSMRVIGTIGALDPRGPHGERRFSLFTGEQRSAIAFFLETLPTLVDLWNEDAKVASRSRRSYWQQFL